MSELLVVGIDQLTEEMEIFDLSLLKDGEDLQTAKVLSFRAGHAAGVKYRKDTVFGDVLITAGTVSYLYSYPSGEVLWSTDKSGNNSHSVEILPSGNILIANSTGNDVRLFYTSALLTGDAETEQTFVSYPYGCTHGLLYDPVYECLWVYGEWGLEAWRVVGDGLDQRLEPIEGKKWSIQDYNNSGHDVAPDRTDSRYLFCTPNSGVLRFDKETGTFDRTFSNEAGLTENHLRCFAQTPDGICFYTESNLGKGRSWEGWWKASWLTDRITMVRPLPEGGYEKVEYPSDRAAFYKCRDLTGTYL